MSLKQKPWFKYLLVALAIVAAYFINVEVQTYFGEKALAATGLPQIELPDALAKAKAENKLVLADLSAIWCPTCRALDKSIFADPRVQAVIDERFIFSRIEYESDAGQAFQERYDTTTFPTLLILNPDGAKVKELPITTDPQEFLAYL